MLRDKIIEKLRADRPVLETYGVKAIAVFGSVARGEANADSDVDVLVEYHEESIPGLFGFVNLRRHLEDVLERRVDLATPKALHPSLRDAIVKDLVYA